MEGLRAIRLLAGVFGAGLCALGLSTSSHAQDFFTLKGHGGPIMDIAVSPTGQIATASFDNSVGVWRDGQPDWLDGSRAAVNAVIFADETTIIAAGDDFIVRGWSLGSKEPAQIAQHTAKVTSLALHPSGGILASASWDGTVNLQRVDIPGVETDVSFDDKTLKGHAQGVNDVVFSQDGNTVYSASVDGTIRKWNLKTGQETQQLVKHGFGVNTLILNEAEGWLAYGALDGVTRIVDLISGKPIADYSLERRPVLSMAFDPPSGLLAVGDGEGYIMVIDTSNKRIARDFRATGRGPVWALAFSRNGQNLHAGGLDDTMFSWPVASMDEHGQMTTEQRSFLIDPEDMSNGERQFMRKCSICHTLTEGSARRAGPTLHRVFGRPAGTITDYSYSATLKGSDIIWSDETIDALFDEGPDHFIPGSKMPMQRITEASDRDDLIKFLRENTN